jgi:hypothetical protein
LINNISELNWKVENEADVDHYNVERSVDGVVFEFIGAVKSKNRVSVSYDYPDDVKSVTSTRIYYRLQQVNRNGEKFYSDVVRFKREIKQIMTIKTHPNPITDYFVLTVTSAIRQPANVVIYDLSGKAVGKRLIQVEKGENSFKFNKLNHLSKGMYLVKVVTVENTYVDRFMKE